MSDEFSQHSREYYDTRAGAGKFDDVVADYESKMLDYDMDPEAQEEARQIAADLSSLIGELSMLSLAIDEARSKGDHNYVAFSNALLIAQIQGLDEVAAKQALVLAVSQLSKAVGILSSLGRPEDFGL